MVLILPENSYFFDTYALFEIIKGNPRYDPYLSSVGIVTTRLNLMELYYGLLLRHGLSLAEQYYEQHLPNTVEIEDALIKEAAAFRANHRKKGFSYVDCLGYVLAHHLDIPFLTGDKAFKGMDGVRFVP